MRNSEPEQKFGVPASAGEACLSSPERKVDGPRERATPNLGRSLPQRLLCCPQLRAVLVHLFERPSHIIDVRGAAQEDALLDPCCLVAADHLAHRAARLAVI